MQEIWRQGCWLPHEEQAYILFASCSLGYFSLNELWWSQNSRQISHLYQCSHTIRLYSDQPAGATLASFKYNHHWLYVLIHDLCKI